MKKIIRRNQRGLALDALVSFPPLLQRIYATRGVQELADLDRNLDALLPYHQLKDIDKAVKFLADALQQQKKCLIVGDFDADGATSTAVAVSALRLLGMRHVDYLVPNRFEYGYGLTPEIVAVAFDKKQPDIIITVDNGISSIEGVLAAHDLGVEVLITDHHLPGQQLPAAAAIVNPNQPGDLFPSKNLAGVGVIFYVMLALRRYLSSQQWFSEQKIAEPNLAQLLDLVALGTVADVVPLDKNNRILVYQGLRRIQMEKTRPGILALLAVAKRRCETLTASDLGYAIAPRLNAAGRLVDMSLGIECLLCTEAASATEMAKQLDNLNQERQTIEAQMQQQALFEIERLQFSQQSLPEALCLYDPDWHQGIIGILAGRVKDKYHRPTLAFAKVNDHELKGSARSIEGLHLRDLLEAIATKHPGLIEKFGGHAMAAGLTLKIEALPAFAKALVAETRVRATEEMMAAKLLSDGELEQGDFSIAVAHLLKEAGPWGQQFPEPLFDGIFDIFHQRLLGQKHLKLVLGVPQTPLQIEAIAFNVDNSIWPNYGCQKLRAAYRLDINEYQGNRSVQLVLQHIEPITS